MNAFKVFFLIVAAAFIAQVCLASANYADDLRLQITQLKQRSAVKKNEYFRDAGIIARKADDAEQYDIASEIMRALFDDSDTAVQEEIENLNSLFEKESLQAARKIPELTRYEKHFQPSANFLQTALGRALNGDLIQFRTNAIEGARNCSDESILQGVQAIKKTGLYVTNSTQEIEAMRSLTEAVNACFSWNPEIVFLRSQPFETLYESGTLTEEAHLKLESSRADLSEARWVGEWVYKYTGREGRGEGVSQAVLTYHKGEDAATMVISTGRISSTGRMNFPNSFAGEKRTIEISGPPLNPQIVFFGKKLNLTGPKSRK